MDATFDAVRERDIPRAGNPAPVADPLNPVAQAVAKRLAGEKARSISPAVLGGLYRLYEFAAIACAGASLYHIYLGSKVPGLAFAYLAIAAATAMVAVVIFNAMGLYKLSVLTRFAHYALRLLAAWAGLVAMLTALAFFAKLGAEFSRMWLGLWFLISGGLVLGGRAGMASITGRLTRNGWLARRAVIVGGGARAGELIKALEASSESGIRICGIFDDRNDERSPPQVARYRKLGTVSELAAFSRSANVDLLIVSLPYTAESRLLEILKQLWVLPVDIKLAAHLNKLRFRPRAYSHIGPVPCLDILDKPLRDWGPVLKSAEDRLLAGLALIGALPLMMLVAVAIRLDSPGPVFFRQRRYGFNNELIEVLKFRSMYTHTADANADRLVTRNDPRVTRIGRIIRRTSLDELPQLINVLRGELSLVGPGPTPPAPRPPTASTPKWWTAISHATRSSPALPAGRR